MARLRGAGFDYIWLMGVDAEPRIPGSRRKEPNLRHAYDLILGKWTDKDIAGSPYAIYNYELDPFLGGPEELLRLKLTLNGMGMGLVVDFVPNHLGLDHPGRSPFPNGS